MSRPSDRFFVVAGGPGSGKTTLLEALSARGLTCTAEAGRAVIRDEIARGGEALPWADADAFAELMLAFDMRAYRHAAECASGPVLFDRGIPDVIGYRRLTGLPVPDACQEAARRCRYNSTVFVAPPWAEIFSQDSERKQTYDEAVRTFDAMTKVYANLGYALAPLPLDTVEARAAFVMDAITRCT